MNSSNPIRTGAKAPWEAPEPSIGQDPWNRSPEARRHPELYTTAHGTSGSQMEDDSLPTGNIFSSNSKEDEKSIKPVTNPMDTNTCERDAGIAFGHTVHKQSSRRRSSVLRDLSLI
ncbi:hypothetical protein BGW37DRAFT_519054 [Umbelopsis sp. PMI_123]|nr:hypothetical protein BGW37DRAFT_519054 [Umbelopsis sp. PMI_123]